MAPTPEFASPCGLYCGVCAIYIAHRDNNLKLKEKLVHLYQGQVPGKGALPGTETLTVDDIACNGCLSRERFLHCRQCDIRTCALEKGMAGCHKCDDFPCRHIDQFPMAVGKKVILRATPYRNTHGTRHWMLNEEERYHCPECGQTTFRGAMACHRCKVPLDLD